MDVEATSSRIIPPYLQELLIVYMDFLKQNKDVIGQDNIIFQIFQKSADMLCQQEYDTTYKYMLETLLNFVNNGLQDIKPIFETGPGNLSYQLVFNESNKKSLYIQITQISSKFKRNVLSTDDYDTLFDAVKIILDVTSSGDVKIQPNFKYMDSDILASYLRQSEETKSRFSADDYKDIVDCFSSVIVENNYYKTRQIYQCIYSLSQ